MPFPDSAYYLRSGDALCIGDGTENSHLNGHLVERGPSLETQHARNETDQPPCLCILVSLSTLSHGNRNWATYLDGCVNVIPMHSLGGALPPVPHYMSPSCSASTNASYHSSFSVLSS